MSIPIFIFFCTHQQPLVWVLPVKFPNVIVFICCVFFKLSSFVLSLPQKSPLMAKRVSRDTWRRGVVFYVKYGPFPLISWLQCECTFFPIRIAYYTVSQVRTSTTTLVDFFRLLFIYQWDVGLWVKCRSPTAPESHTYQLSVQINITWIIILHHHFK